LERRLSEPFPCGAQALALDIAYALLPVYVLRLGQELLYVVNSRLRRDALTVRKVQQRLAKEEA
jgi:hypothetical protein